MKKRYQLYQRRSRSSMRAFLFFGPKKFSSISRFLQVAQSKRMVSVLQTRFPEQYASIFFFRSNKFFFDISISGGCTGERCHRCQSSALNSMRVFFFFGHKMFSSISRKGQRKVSTVTSRCPEQCASIFFFVPIFFF